MRWKEAAIAIAALFLVSRGALGLIALLLQNNVPLSIRGDAYADGYLSSFTGTDSIYFLGIAAEGYHLEPVRGAFRDWAFFPLYPLVTRIVSILTFGNVAVAGMIVSNVAFVAALAVLYVLTVRHFDHDRAVRSLGFVTLGPGAVAFAMAYSDSLFLLLAAGAFLAAEQRRWLGMAVLLGLACLTRAQGLLLAIPLAFLIADSNGGWRSAASWRSPRMAWLLAAPVGFGLFAAHLGATFGQPFGMFSAQQAWSNIGRPETGDTTAVVSRFDPLVLVLIGMLSMYFFLLAFLRRDRIAAPYRVHAWLSIVSTFGLMFFNPSLLQSIARYMAVVWPFDWVLANRRSAWFANYGLAASAALFMIFAVLNFTQTLAP